MGRKSKYTGNITSKVKRITDAPMGGTYVGANFQRSDENQRSGQFRKGRQTVEIVLVLIVLIGMLLAFLFGHIDWEMILLLVAFGLAGIAVLDQHVGKGK